MKFIPKIVFDDSERFNDCLRFRLWPDLQHFVPMIHFVHSRKSTFLPCHFRSVPRNVPICQAVLMRTVKENYKTIKTEGVHLRCILVLIKRKPHLQSQKLRLLFLSYIPELYEFFVVLNRVSEF